MYFKSGLYLFAFVVLTATQVASQLTLGASITVKPIENPLDKFAKFQTPDGDKLDFFDYFVEDVLPPLYGQRPNNENGTNIQYKDIALSDRSNDDAAYLTLDKLITRSGFKYEQFDTVADDGYVTILTHLINPLADRNKLRYPPVLLEHGGTIDPTAYMVASSIQHFPEKWPRSADDGPVRSWNRSLAFLLVNNGFDVWLAETRGANDGNRRRIQTQGVTSVLKGKNEAKNMTVGENIRQILDVWNYWAFSQDDIIAHELKSHINGVLKHSGAKKLHLMTFSLSTPTSLAFLGMRPEYAELIEGYVSMAPIVSGQGTSKMVNLLFETLCPILPNNLGTLFLTDLVFSQPFRDMLVFLFRPPRIRYVIAKSLISLAMGASPKYRTFMDLNFLGHLMKGLSFKELKQMCQQMKANRLQKYDYGPIKNNLIYKQTRPPEYDLSNMKLKNWIIVSAANDALSTPQVVDHLIKIANPKPIARFEAPGFNHADLFAGWENDKYVNLPIMHFFQQLSDAYDSKGNKILRFHRARSLDFSSFLPPEMLPRSIVAPGANGTYATNSTAPNPPLPVDIKVVMDEISKNMRNMIKSMQTEFNRVVGGRFGNLGGLGGLIGANTENRPADAKIVEAKKDKAYGTTYPNEVNTTRTDPVSPMGDLTKLFQGFQSLPQSNEVAKNIGNLMNVSNVLSNFGALGNMLNLPQPPLGANPESKEKIR